MSSPERPGAARVTEPSATASRVRSSLSPSSLCGERHTSRPGTLDERARRLSHPEFQAASILVGEGHRVEALLETPGRGRRADLSVCGQDVEVKSFLPSSQRNRTPAARSVYNKLAAGSRQAPNVLLWSRGSGLMAATAARGVSELFERGAHGRLEAVRVVGDGFDLSWAREQRTSARDKTRRRPTDRKVTGVEMGLH